MNFFESFLLASNLILVQSPGRFSVALSVSSTVWQSQRRMLQCRSTQARGAWIVVDAACPIAHRKCQCAKQRPHDANPNRLISNAIIPHASHVPYNVEGHRILPGLSRMLCVLRESPCLPVRGTRPVAAGRCSTESNIAVTKVTYLAKRSTRAGKSRCR